MKFKIQDIILLMVMLILLILMKDIQYLKLNSMAAQNYISEERNPSFYVR